MYSIKRDAFIKTLKRFPDDYEKYFCIKDRLSMQNDLSDLGSACWTCGS